MKQFEDLLLGLVIVVIVAISGVFWISRFQSDQLVKEVSNTSTETPTPSPFRRLNADREFEMINEYRKSKGLKPFVRSEELCQIAEKRASFFIDNPENRKCMGDRTCPNGGHIEIERFRTMYTGKAMGENVGAYAQNDEENINGWKTSPKHNANLLAKGWNGVEVDMACVVTKEIPGNNVIILLVGDK